MKLCKCGCGEEIIIKLHHSWYGVPNYLPYHHKMFKKGNQYAKGNKPNNTSFRNGHKSWAKDRKFTKEHRENLSISHRGNEGYWKGRTDKKSHRKDLSWEEEYGLTKTTELKLKRAKQILPVRDTKIEVKTQNFLKELGIEFFTHQYMKEIEHGYQCDILIPSMNLIIECDGDYWHKYPIGNELDHTHTKELMEKGFKVLRLWECEIKEMDVNDFKNRLYDNGTIFAKDSACS